MCMRKYVFGFVISMGICVAAGAQTQKNWHWSMGPNAGFGGSWIDNFTPSKYKPAGNVGLSLIYSTKSSFGMGADVKYSFEGGKREYQTTVPGTTLTTVEEANLNYVRVPIKAMWFFNKYGDRVRPKIALGPSFGFLVGGKTTANTTTSTGSSVSNSSVDSKDYWDDFDLGLTGSVGLNYRLVKYTWLSADISYFHGLTDAREDSQRGAGYAADKQYKNRNLQFNLGVNFGL
jgi:outer membrane protein W